MENMSPQQQHESSRATVEGEVRGRGPQENKKRMRSLSHRRQSAPSMVITKALIRSKTVSRDSFQVPLCPETCPLIQSYLSFPERSFILHSHAQLKTGLQTQERHLFLFSDMLLITKAKSGNHFKQKAQVWLCDMWTAGCMEEVCEGSTSPERGFVMGWPTCNCVALFSSAEQKEKWLSFLKSRIKEEKEREDPKTIPLKVYSKGINTFAPDKTLPVSNSDSANEVVRLALQQFDIAGSVKDYQLWVISKRDNTPYPLIGHEFPFNIQLSHVRAAPSQGGTGRDVMAPPDRQRALQAEQLLEDKQCRFVLKLRPGATTQAPSIESLSQKPFKRRRSLIPWAFWRGSSPQLCDSSLAQSRQGSGCLFGQPLSSVCLEDALPKPVMDMLFFLYHEGSWTRGIFRRSAGARAVRELRDSLDAGQSQMPLNRDHVFIIAGVFKDFLRSIPGSLLCSDLYEEWMEVLEEDEEEEEQVGEIQRLTGRLPKQNATLLHYVAAMLHGIQSHAHDNQMTSFNLSVCFAPSMLWSPGPCSPELEGEGAKKVCELVKFMIDHCQKILGQEPSTLFGGPPQRQSAEEISAAETWSYDSLENELDDCSSGGAVSPALGRHLGPKPLRGSLDSILTFSDYDQDSPARGPARHNQAAPSESPLTSPLDPRAPEGPYRQQRRCSEPAIAYAAGFTVCVPGGTEGRNVDEDANEGFCRRPGGRAPLAPLDPRGQNRNRAPLRPQACSPTTTTHSSLDSLDALPGASTPCDLARAALPPSVAAEQGPYPKGSTHKQLLAWATLRSSRGLHPNSWLKKARRLSLTQQDNLEDEEKDKKGSSDKSLAGTKPGVEKGGPGKYGRKLTSDERPRSKPLKAAAKEVAGEQLSRKARGQEPPGHHRSTGSLHLCRPLCLRASDLPPAQPGKPPNTACNLATGSAVDEADQPPHRRTGLPLSLFRRQRYHSVTPEEEEGDALRSQRRASEPGLLQSGKSPALDGALHLQRPYRGAVRQRLPSDPGLKVSKADTHGGVEPHFCLSPCAAKTVQGYFESHPRSSQQVALDLVESQRKWLRRHSDPAAEPELEKFLFSEESYV